MARVHLAQLMVYLLTLVIQMQTETRNSGDLPLIFALLLLRTGSQDDSDSNSCGGLIPSDKKP